MESRNRSRLIPLCFLFGAVLDFLWGYFHEHSLAAGLVGIFLGLFGTAWYLFITGAWSD